MNKLKAITVRNLTNGAHYTFIRNVLIRAKTIESILEKAGNEVEALEKALADENLYLKIPQKSALTAQIGDARKEVANLLGGLKRTLRGLLHIPNTELAAAAQRVLDQVLSYRIKPYSQVDKVIGLVENLVEDLENGLNTDVETVSLTSFVTNLKEANETVRTLIMSREDNRGSYKRDGTKIARKVTDEKYQLLIEKIEALIVIDGEEDYLPFINGVNEQIIRLRQDALNQKVNNKPEEDDSDKTTPDNSGDTSEPDNGTEPDIPTEPEEDEPIVQ